MAATQNPQAVQDTVAKALGIGKDDVLCHVTLLGGGFGRKSKPDYVAEAALLSKQVGKPVKIVWSREDDVHFDYFHSPAALYMKAAVDEKGHPTAWLQRSAFPPIAMQMIPTSSTEDFSSAWGGPTYLPDSPSTRGEWPGESPCSQSDGCARCRISIMPSAWQSFTDELAAAAGRDRVEYLLELIGQPRVIDFGKKDSNRPARTIPKYPFDTLRLRNVIEVAAHESGWASKKGNRRTSAGHCGASQFSDLRGGCRRDRINGSEIRIPRVDIALDAGRIINPDRVKAQFEGAAVFGTSIALMSEITAAAGRIQQSEFRRISGGADESGAARNARPYSQQRGSSSGRG